MKNSLIFPISIWEAIWDDSKTDRLEMIDESYRLKKNDPKGVRNTNRGSWHSQMDLYNNKVCAKINSLIKDVIVNTVIPKEYPTFTDNDVEIETMWFIISNHGNYSIPHIHQSTWYSGIFYVKVPENNEASGVTRFIDTNLMRSRVKEDFKGSYHQDIEIIPENGKIVFFPSWLLHSVKENQTYEDRITYVFTVKSKTIG